MGSYVGKIISPLITVIFGVIAIHFYRRSRRFKALRLVIMQDISVVNVFEEAREQIKIAVQDREIENLCKLKLAFQNCGTLEITERDIRRAPVVYLDKGEFITKPEITDKSPNLDIEIRSVENRNDELRLDFDLIDRGEQVTFEVLCDKENGSSLNIRARIAGVPDIRKVDVAIRHPGPHNVIEFLQRRIQQAGLVIWWGGGMFIWGIAKSLIGRHKITLKAIREITWEKLTTSGIEGTTWHELTTSAFLVIVGLVPIIYGCRYLFIKRSSLRLFSGTELARLLTAPVTVLQIIRRRFLK